MSKRAPAQSMQKQALAPMHKPPKAVRIAAFFLYFQKMDIAFFFSVISEQLSVISEQLLVSSYQNSEQQFGIKKINDIGYKVLTTCLLLLTPESISFLFPHHQIHRLRL